MEPVDKFEKLKQWYEKKAQVEAKAKPLIEAEMDLRKEEIGRASCRERVLFRV